MFKFSMKFMIVMTAISVILEPLAHCEGFKYESHGRRDPFVSLVGPEKSTITKLEDITSIDDINLEGIAIGAKGHRIAIINGEMLKERDKVGDIELKAIGKKAVRISIGDKEYKVNLPEEGGQKSET